MITARTEPALPADLAPLMPRRSPLRNAALVVLGVLVLVGAWLSPALLRPSLTGSSGGGWAVELPESDTLLTVTQLRPEAWPHATVIGIEAVPGAAPLAAWVFLEPTTPTGSGTPTATTPHRLLEENYPGLAFPAEGNLPARVHRSSAGASFDDGGLVLAIAWEVTDCSALVSDDGISSGTEEDEPRAVVRSALGSESRAVLGESASPASWAQFDSVICGD